ncbi:phage major capsid protein [Paenibacillus sp. BK720]|uniref:phage major capsid protein n=1 Tax=Paenibacillus sp. BK720 TaxID=2587092 RepID=UPI00141FC99A|nr:phage major capsid protein [Paenibacillus sp. BK720]NIK68780.1 HK97 family phage major capsid protein/HK97 family phage prohead protease [Paenibacillus sp. BK720]
MEHDYRSFTGFEARAAAEGSQELWADGYAAKFNSPTVLYERGGVEYKEVIAPGAFDGADMSDVIFNYDHKGKVMARTRNKTLMLSIDSTGLKVNARLDGTDEGRKLHQEIRGGYVDKMSFRFKVAPGGDKYDAGSRTRTITKIQKVYDVSAVDIPAYDDTNISARSYFEAAAEQEERTAFLGKLAPQADDFPSVADVKAEARAMIEKGGKVDYAVFTQRIEEERAWNQKRIEQRAAVLNGFPNSEYRTLIQPEVIEMTNFETMKPYEVRNTEEYRSAFFKSLQGQELNEQEQRAFTFGQEQRSFTTDGNSAGAVIPTTTYGQVLKKLEQVSALYPHINASNIPGNVVIPVEIGESGAVWVEELEDLDEGGNPLGSVKLGGYTLAKLIPISIAAQSMSAPAFESYLVDIIVSKLGVGIEKAIVAGTGVGQATGIMTGVTWSANNSFTYTTAIKYDDLLKPLAGLGSEYRMNAAWVMNSVTLYQQIAKVTGEDGRLIFVPDAVNGFAGYIMGKPVIVSEYMPDGQMLFGDLKYYFMNFSQPILFEKSRESGFRRAAVDYRGVAVVDGKPAQSEAFTKLTAATN